MKRDDAFLKSPAVLCCIVTLASSIRNALDSSTGRWEQCYDYIQKEEEEEEEEGRRRRRKRRRRRRRSKNDDILSAKEWDANLERFSPLSLIQSERS
jgi:DNA replication protein DnaC